MCKYVIKKNYNSGQFILTYWLILIQLTYLVGYVFIKPSINIHLEIILFDSEKKNLTQKHDVIAEVYYTYVLFRLYSVQFVLKNSHCKYNDKVFRNLIA